VTLIGAGGIGAISALALAKMGVRYIEVWDDDVVSDVNLPTQLHRIDDEGRPKVDALGAVLMSFSDEVQVDRHADRVGQDSQLRANYIISAVDSITARKAIWEAVKRGVCSHYLDARMGAEVFHLHVVDMDSPETYAWYEQLLSGEDEGAVADLPCTQKATFYTACIAAGHIGNGVKRLAMGQDCPRMLIHDIQADSLITL
jgi:molybdopterin/thiamine biosynthesis adenylyltransferase